MELGIIHNPDEAITGAQLNEMDDETFARNIEHYLGLRQSTAGAQGADR